MSLASLWAAGQLGGRPLAGSLLHRRHFGPPGVHPPFPHLLATPRLAGQASLLFLRRPRFPGRQVPAAPAPHPPGRCHYRPIGSSGRAYDLGLGAVAPCDQFFGQTTFGFLVETPMVVGAMGGYEETGRRRQELLDVLIPDDDSHDD